MNKSQLWLVALIVGGVAVGPWAYSSAKSAQPPLDWIAVLVAFCGTIIGVLFVIGLQALLRKPDGVRSVFANMRNAAVFFAASGASACAIAWYRGDTGPAAFFILALGIAALASVGISRIAFRGAFAT